MTRPVEPPIPTTALLATKFHIPTAHPDIVNRPRLIARLIEGMSRKLTLVSAPPGSGKTTLLAAWRASDFSRSIPIAWLTTDEADNDPNRYLNYLVAAIGRVAPEGVAGLDALIRASVPLEVEPVLVQLINNLEPLGGQLGIVIDDYHVIDNSIVHRAMDFLLTHAPAGMHVIIASRTDPPLALPRLRVRGQLVEIRAEDLRFTSSEVGALLRDVAGLEVTPNDAELLATRTDGWAAGLHLATLSIQNRSNVEQWVGEFDGSHRFVADYLLEEVISRQPVEVQEFLIRTSILDRFTAQLCEAVSGAAACEEMLHYLERGNLFTIALDDGRRWFRYHSLFADLLRSRLDELHPGLRDDLNMRASDWFRDHGIGAEAVEYALRAGDVERAAIVLDEDDIAVDALFAGELSTLLRWIEAIGEATLFHHPKLNGVAVWALLSTGRIAEIDPYLEAMERFAAVATLTNTEQSIVRGIVAAGRSAQAVHRQDYERTIELSDEALCLLPLDYPIARTNALYDKGFAQGLTGRSSVAVETFRRSVATLGPNGPMPFQMSTRTALAQSLLHRARLSEAECVLKELLDEIRSRRLEALPYVGFIRICLARILYQRGELIESLAESEAGVALASRWITTGFQLEGHFTAAVTHLAMGNEGEAERALEPARSLVPRTGANPLLGRIEALDQYIAMRRGDQEPVQWASAQLHRLPTSPEALWPWIQVRRQAVRILTDAGLLNQASEAAAQLSEAAERFDWPLYALQMRVALARCLWMTGDGEGARSTLNQAIEATEGEHLAQLFVDAGPEVGEILVAVRDARGASEWISTLIDRFGYAEPKGVRVVQRDRRRPDLPESLSERELEVLTKIRDGRSNNQIADELFLALGTVKRHTHNIFGKLGVNSRTQAVARARQLGLLDDE